jgi:mannose-6-phosphate isomerase-like protein (cupin superfamily)
MIRQTSDKFRWKGVDILPYKEDGGTHFKSISRQTLFRGSRGSGQVFVGDTITPINTHDVVHIPPFTWHQFRATNGEELGFLCVVSMERDKPQRPTPENLDELGQIPGVTEFIRV